MGIWIETPGGTVAFDVPVMKIQDHTQEELFAKGLLFLIPFYISTHEHRFKEYDKDKEKLGELKAEYISIMERLDRLLRTGKISAYTYSVRRHFKCDLLSAYPNTVFCGMM